MEIITWIREISARENLSVIRVCRDMDPAADPEKFRDHKDLSAAGNVLRARLYHRRYPSLDRAKKEAASRVQALKLPKGVRLALPENFESMVYTLTLSFADPEEFQGRLAALANLTNAQDFNALLKR